MAEAQRFQNRQTIMTAKAATGIGTSINVRDFQNIMLQVATASTATLTIKVQGSLKDTEPDFSSSATASNPWAYVAVFDYIDPSTVIAGGTGISTVATDYVKNLLVNVDGLCWINVSVTAYTQGSVTVESISFNNQ